MLERVAYHEAGHAVAAVAVGRRFLRVSIIPDDETVGRCTFPRPSRPFHSITTVDGRDRRRLNAAIVTTLAGLEAEAIFSGEASPRVIGGHWHRALGLAAIATRGGADEAAASVAHLRAWTLTLLRDPP